MSSVTSDPSSAGTAPAATRVPADGTPAVPAARGGAALVCAHPDPSWVEALLAGDRAISILSAGPPHTLGAWPNP